MLYFYKATVRRVIDGDTLEAKVDLGFNIQTDKTVKLIDIDTPEITGEESKAGKIVGKYVRDMVDGETIYIHTKEKDSFGRWLAEVYLDEEKEDSLNEHLLDREFALEYPAEWIPEELNKIIENN